MMRTESVRMPWRSASAPVSVNAYASSAAISEARAEATSAWRDGHEAVGQLARVGQGAAEAIWAASARDATVSVRVMVRTGSSEGGARALAAARRGAGC